MAHLIRGKQAGIHNDLSAGLGPDLFVLDHIRNYGINSKVTQIAYDPVQSLLAVGTSESKYGNGQIYVFGQNRVEVVFALPRQASVQILQFCAEKLICVDSKNDLSVFSLDTKKLVNAHSTPAKITALHTDPTLDYALLGTQHGEVLAYDLDRECLAPLNIPDLWRARFPHSPLTSVVTLALHPRDIGSLLIGYNAGAVLYSFKQNNPITFFNYVLPKGAPGGDSDPGQIFRERAPPLTQAVWHPTGSFILTGHEDSSIVIWDPKDGRIIQARTLQDTNVNKPGPPSFGPGATDGTFALKSPIFKIAWCANQDPDDTAILVAGGQPSNILPKSLTLFELGRTPVYNTSTWQSLSDHFETPKRQRILPCPPGSEVIDLFLIPRSSPHFAGCHDPIAIIALLASGELITLSFPSGMPVCPTNQLHLSMTLIHPYLNYLNLAAVERTKWLGMTEKRSHGPKFLHGGAGAVHPLKRFENRNVVQTAHADGTIRLWDAGHADEIENDAMLQVDVARAVGRQDLGDITKTSFSGASSEMSVGLGSGDVAVFRWDTNKHSGQELSAGDNEPQGLTNIIHRAEASVKEGLLPFTLLAEGNGPVTALEHSDVGFVAAGFEGGNLVIIDLRGPAIIYRGSTSEFSKPDKRGSFRKSSSNTATAKREWVTSLAFSVMTLDGEDYSSILVHAGTNLGHLATFKLLPEVSGKYTVKFAGLSSLDNKVISICPMHAETGRPAYASQSIVAGLRTGAKVDGILLAVSTSGLKLFRPASNKGASKTFDQFLCDTASVVRYEDLGYALLGLYGDGCARAFSIPALKEIGAVKVSDVLDIRRFSEAVITTTGDIIGWKGPAEMALINIFGHGLQVNTTKDILLNPELLIPPRPTISNMQWISGTQHVTPADMDLLIGGPDRPPSKRMLAQARSEAEQARRANRASGPSASTGYPKDPRDGPAPPSAEGWGSWATRQLNERTERLQGMSDGMNNLSVNSQGWADDVNKFVGKQKRGFVMGAVKSKFGF